MTAYRGQRHRHALGRDHGDASKAAWPRSPTLADDTAGTITLAFTGAGLTSPASVSIAVSPGGGQPAGHPHAAVGDRRAPGRRSRPSRSSTKRTSTATSRRATTRTVVTAELERRRPAPGDDVGDRAGRHRHIHRPGRPRRPAMPSLVFTGRRPGLGVDGRDHRQPGGGASSWSSTRSPRRRRRPVRRSRPSRSSTRRTSTATSRRATTRTMVTATLASGTGPLQGTTTVTAARAAWPPSPASPTTRPRRSRWRSPANGLTSPASSPIAVTQAAAGQAGDPGGAVIHGDGRAAVRHRRPARHRVRRGPVRQPGDRRQQHDGDGDARPAAPGPLQGTVTVTLTGGVATFTNLADNTAGTITLAFSGGGLTSPATGSITVSPAAATAVGHPHPALDRQRRPARPSPSSR